MRESSWKLLSTIMRMNLNRSEVGMLYYVTCLRIKTLQELTAKLKNPSTEDMNMEELTEAKAKLSVAR